MSPELYDLFMGHEVGHALNTPYEGLHSTLEKTEHLKDILMLLKTLGLRKQSRRNISLVKSFFAAYKELVAKDFFGINDKDVNKLSLIDKINIKTKVGAFSWCCLHCGRITFLRNGRSMYYLGRSG